MFRPGYYGVGFLVFIIMAFMTTASAGETDETGPDLGEAREMLSVDDSKFKEIFGFNRPTAARDLKWAVKRAQYIAAWGANYALEGNWPEACRFYALAAALGGGSVPMFRQLHSAAVMMLTAKERKRCIERARETRPYDIP